MATFEVGIQYTLSNLGRQMSRETFFDMLRLAPEHEAFACKDILVPKPADMQEHLYIGLHVQGIHVLSGKYPGHQWFVMGRVVPRKIAYPDQMFPGEKLPFFLLRSNLFWPSATIQFGERSFFQITPLQP